MDSLALPARPRPGGPLRLVTSRCWRLALSLAAIWLTSVPAALSQSETKPDPSSPAAVPQPAATANPAAAGAIREQTIYIPYEKLRKTFESQGRGVFLPYEKFQELWQAARAQHLPPPEQGPPVKAVITEIESEAVVEHDIVRVTAELTFDLLGSGWIEVPLRLRGAAVLSAELDGQPARLVSDPQGGKKLLLERSADGPHEARLQLVYAQSITKTPGQNSVAFAAPLAPVNRWRIRIPEAGVKVNVEPMLAATEVPEDSDTTGETVVLAFVGAAPEVRIEWTPKALGASGLEALVSVQTEQEYAVADGVARTKTRLDYAISRAELAELKIRVPADQKVVNVVDANVREWSVATEGESQTISIGLFQPARQRQSIEVELEQFTDQTAASLTVPALEALDVARQRGVVAIKVDSGLRAETVRTAGLSQLDVSDVPKRLRQAPIAFAYRYAAVPYELALRIEKVEPRIHVDQLVEAYLEPQRLSLDLFAHYTIRRAGVFELQLDLPADYQILAVQGRGTDQIHAADVDTHFAAPAQNGRRLLKVNLASKAEGEVGLQVRLQRSLDDPNLANPTGDSARLPVTPPRAAAESVERSTGRLVVSAPESLRLVVEQASGLRTISFDEAFRALASARDDRFPELRPVQAFAFGEETVSAVLVAQRRQPQVAVRQLLFTRIDPGVVKYTATFYFDIRYSGVDALRIDLPQALAGQVRNETPSLRETTIVPPPADVAEDYVAWSISGETELLGAIQCTLTWEVPLEELGIGTSVQLEVPRLIPHGVDRAEGQIVLAKAETIDVQPQGSPIGLDPIDPQHDLMEGAQFADAAAALEFHDDWKLTLQATRYQLETVKQTSVEQGLLRMVITRSDRVAVQALYRMRSSRQRLQLRLPQSVAAGQIEFHTDPLRINGRRIPLERGNDDQTFFVPLVGMSADTPFLLELRYTAPGNGSQLAYPTFPDEPAVQKVDLVAYLPNSRTYLGKRGPWNYEGGPAAGSGLLALAAGPSVPRPSDVAPRIAKLAHGITLPGNPAEDFPTAGRPLVFSTLRPAAPDVGALRLTTIDRQLLNGLIFAIVSIPGVLLLARPPSERWLALFGFVTAVVLAGVFLPSLATAVLNETLLLAVLVIVLLWLTLFVVRTLPRWWSTWNSRVPPPVAQTPTPASGEQGGASHA